MTKQKNKKKTNIKHKKHINNRNSSNNIDEKEDKKKNAKYDKDDKDTKETNLENLSLLDYKTKKSFSVATSLSNYKSKTYIGEIYDYKPLHDKINNMCINSLMAKKKNINKKISKNICECIFDKNKELSIIELDNKVKNKKYTPSTECIKIYDKFKLDNSMPNISMHNSMHNSIRKKTKTKSKRQKSNSHKSKKTKSKKP